MNGNLWGNAARKAVEWYLDLGDDSEAAMARLARLRRKDPRLTYRKPRVWLIVLVLMILSAIGYFLGM